MTDRTQSAGDGAGEQFKTQGAHAARRDELCLLPLGDRIAHFSKRCAYLMPDGKALRMQPPKRLPKLNASGFTRDAGGVFYTKKPIIGLPCVGIPTARYLHGRRDYLIGDTGKVHLTRCHRCELKDLCERMCDELLHHSGDAVDAAWRRFMDYGGWSAIAKGWARKDSRANPAAARLRELVQALQDAGVTFANDADVRDYIERRRAEGKVKAAERQRKSRLARAKAEYEPRTEPSHNAPLVAQAKALQERIRSAQQGARCPRRLAALDANFAAQVWAVREKLTSQSKRHGATRIARALAKATPGIDHDALRKRVSRVLEILPLIQALP